MELKLERLRDYLVQRYGPGVEVAEMRDLGGGVQGTKALKQFGYGRPLLVEFSVSGKRHQEVIHRIRPTNFGRERSDDRVAAVWLDYQTFNELPRHVRAVDVLAHHRDHRLQSLAGADELLLATRYQPGSPYADDLSRLREEGQERPGDRERAGQLAAYLADIHAVKKVEPALWRRRLRDLVGHGEGIMGLTDSYPPDLDYAPPALLRSIEEAANRWRWQLKSHAHRMSQVHGDFHPFNILFTEQGELYLLDRSRGAWGEPADDVSCLSINYLFFSLQRAEKLTAPFETLYRLFWQRYLVETDDLELLEVIQPWYAWRALVLASPVWYPTLSTTTRRRLLTFATQIMQVEQFDYGNINDYLEPWE